MNKISLSIGDRPGWNPPVLLLITNDGTAEINITRKQATALKSLGIPVQG